MKSKEYLNKLFEADNFMEPQSSNVYEENSNFIKLLKKADWDTVHSVSDLENIPNWKNTLGSNNYPIKGISGYIATMINNGEREWLDRLWTRYGSPTISLDDLIIFAKDAVENKLQRQQSPRRSKYSSSSNDQPGSADYSGHGGFSGIRGFSEPI